jgi:1-deoxy-D-xylulose-5-phosphate synthase
VEWGEVFGEELLAIGEERSDIVAITAAMLLPTRLGEFAERFPDRVFDVGIAEQHATTSAAGLAIGGLHPVFAVYATFLNRAFDQILMDVALHKCGVTFALTHAGVTGNDGPSHNGMWDLAMLQIVPGLRIAAPRDGATLRSELREAVAVEDAPTVVRYPKGPVCPDIPAVGNVGGIDVLHEADDRDVLLVSVGAMAETCLEVAQRCARQGIGVTVVDPRWVKPLPAALVDLARDYRCVVTVEDGIRSGGVGSMVAQLLRDEQLATPLRDFGIPARFLEHAKRSEVLAEIGLTAQDISREIFETVAGLDAVLDRPESPKESERGQR